MSILPDDVMKRVDTEFKTRQSKAVALELLTSWRKMPSWKEKETIGERHGRNVKTVHEISQKLQELELFTAEQGSIPLFRMELEKQQVQPSNLEGLCDEADSQKIMTELPLVSPMGVPLEEEPMVPVLPSSGGQDEFDDLKNKVYRMEAEIGSIGKQIENIVPVLQGLSAKTTGNPELNSNPQTPQTENSVIRSPESVDDRIERIEAILKDRSVGDPFDDLSREQILELVRSQPQELLSMVSPGKGNPEGRMQATEVTLRPIIVMMTTYTQMLFEKVVHDGYFEGTLSDFLNFAAEQYFTDRGWSLDWNRREPANRRRLG